MIIGLVFILITFSLINNYIIFPDPLIVFLTVDIIFWVLVFILPGIVKFKQKTYDFIGTKFVFWDGVAIITALSVLIYALIIYNLAKLNFLNTFFAYFWYVLGGGLLIGLIVMAIAVYTDVTL